MKQGFAIALSALMALSFFGCRSSDLHATNITEASQATTESTAVVTTQTTTVPTEATVPMPNREMHIQLEFFLEGMVEYQDATLYVGDGYSLYITDDDWTVTPGENGEVTWTSGYNPDIVLQVFPNAGEDAKQVQDSLFHGYIVYSTEGEYVFGRDESGNFYRAARLIETPKGILTAVWDYTLEAVEGFGARLYVIAGTLEPTNE